MENLKHQDITDGIIGAFYRVYNELGYGFLEKVYERALYYDLIAHGYKVECQKRVTVFYLSYQVGDYFADLFVNDVVIVEIKAAEGIAKENEYQLINYLKATGKEVGLLLNFGEKPQFERKVFSKGKVTGWNTDDADLADSR